MDGDLLHLVIEVAKVKSHIVTLIFTDVISGQNGIPAFNEENIIINRHHEMWV